MGVVFALYPVPCEMGVVFAHDAHACTGRHLGRSSAYPKLAAHTSIRPRLPIATPGPSDGLCALYPVPCTTGASYGPCGGEAKREAMGVV